MFTDVMSLEVWLSFAAASLLLVIAPGPAVALMVSTGLSRGRRAALSLIPGYFFGDLVAMVLSFAGLGALLMTSAKLFVLLKWLGALYLVYLGWRMWREARQLGDAEPTVNGTRHLGAQAFLVSVLNPKSLLFFLAFMPQFIDPTTAAIPQLILLGLTFLGLGLFNDLAYALLSSSGGQMLRAPTRRLIHRTGAVCMVGAGLATAAIRRQ
ncbi:LysE family translocator [Halomonas cupida]|uniref:LysE family translocator n=1 Tax=Halomonas cupida TaxID=44933 RepID=UPI0039B41583